MWRFLLSLPILLLAVSAADAVSPATATQCRQLTLQSPDLSSADRMFLNEHGGGILELCRHPQFETVTANTYFSGVTQPAPGLCHYVIGDVTKAQSGQDWRWTLGASPTKFQRLTDDNGACLLVGDDGRSLRHWNDTSYTRIGNVGDDLSIAFLRHWRAMMTSRAAFIERLPPKQSQAVAERRDEPLWLLTGCIAVAAKGCRAEIEYLDATSYDRPLIRARFRILNFSQIDDLNAGKILYQPNRVLYENTLNFWRTPAGFELQR